MICLWPVKAFSERADGFAAKCLQSTDEGRLQSTQHHNWIPIECHVTLLNVLMTVSTDVFITLVSISVHFYVHNSIFVPVHLDSASVI